jgi:hypothetical protein
MAVFFPMPGAACRDATCAFDRVACVRREAIMAAQKTRDATLDPLRHCLLTSRRHIPALAVVQQHRTMRAGFARDRALASFVRLLENTRDLCYDANDDIYADGTRPFMQTSEAANVTTSSVDAMIKALGELRWVRSGRPSHFAAPCEADGSLCPSAAAFWAQAYKHLRPRTAGHVVLRRMYGEMVLAFAEMLQDAALIPLGSVQLLLGRGDCVPGLALTRRSGDPRCWAAVVYDYLQILLVADTVRLSQHALFTNKNAQRGLRAARKLFHALSTMSYAQSTQPICRAPYTVAIVALPTQYTPLPYALSSFSGNVTPSSYNDRAARARSVRLLADDARISFPELRSGAGTRGFL